MFLFQPKKRRQFDHLPEREVIALAITAEEEDGRIYLDYAEALREEFPAAAKMFEEMAKEESEHRAMLIEMYQQKFGQHIPLIRRSDVSGFYSPQPAWKVFPKGLDAVRAQAREMEQHARRFYEDAAQRSTDANIRKLLGDLALAEAAHDHTAQELEDAYVESDAHDEEAHAHRRKFVLQIVQPGLIGLMDGSVSTLAPIFAAAFATHNSWDTFLVGSAASIGAGISMGFAEALSDDGELSGRGSPWVRGVVSGVMTTIGGLGHTLPYLISDVKVATAIALAVVVLELLAIAWIRKKYMDSPWGESLMQIVVGGALVLAAGVLIGHG